MAKRPSRKLTNTWHPLEAEEGEMKQEKNKTIIKTIYHLCSRTKQMNIIKAPTDITICVFGIEDEQDTFVKIIH